MASTCTNQTLCIMRWINCGNIGFIVPPRCAADAPGGQSCRQASTAFFELAAGL